jgi:hypothetical protein
MVKKHVRILYRGTDVFVYITLISTNFFVNAWTFAVS